MPLSPPKDELDDRLTDVGRALARSLLGDDPPVRPRPRSAVRGSEPAVPNDASSDAPVAGRHRKTVATSGDVDAAPAPARARVADAPAVGPGAGDRSIVPTGASPTARQVSTPNPGLPAERPIQVARPRRPNSNRPDGGQPFSAPASGQTAPQTPVSDRAPQMRPTPRDHADQPQARAPQVKRPESPRITSPTPGASPYDSLPWLTDKPAVARSARRSEQTVAPEPQRADLPQDTRLRRHDISEDPRGVEYPVLTPANAGSVADLHVPSHVARTSAGPTDRSTLLDVADRAKTVTKRIPKVKRPKRTARAEPDLQPIPDGEWDIEESKADSRAKKVGRGVLEYAVMFSVVVIVVLLLRQFVVQVYEIPSESMYPTLTDHDRVVVNRLAYTVPGFGGIDRGDVIVFKRPASETTGDPDQPEQYIKRVIGLPGDVVEAREGVVYIDGKPLDEVGNDGYLPPDVVTNNLAQPVTVKKGTVFVMGDNRERSRDSRFFGAIPESDIYGRAMAVVWPFNRWRSL